MRCLWVIPWHYTNSLSPLNLMILTSTDDLCPDAWPVGAPSSYSVTSDTSLIFAASLVSDLSLAYLKDSSWVQCLHLAAATCVFQKASYSGNEYHEYKLYLCHIFKIWYHIAIVTSSIILFLEKNNLSTFPKLIDFPSAFCSLKISFFLESFPAYKTYIFFTPVSMTSCSVSCEFVNVLHFCCILCFSP